MLLLLTKELLMSVSLTEAGEKQINLFQVDTKMVQVGVCVAVPLTSKASLPSSVPAERCQRCTKVRATAACTSAWPKMGCPSLTSTVLSGLTCKARSRANYACSLSRRYFHFEVSRQRSHLCSTACLCLHLCCAFMLPTQSVSSQSLHCFTCTPSLLAWLRNLCPVAGSRNPEPSVCFSHCNFARTRLAK